MVGITSLFAGAFSLFILWVRPGAALGMVILSLMVWPEYLRIPTGIAEMSVPRIAALVLLAKLVLSGKLSKIRFSAVDWFVIALWLWTVIAATFAGGDYRFVARLIGQGLDTMIMYFIARLSISSAQDIKNLALPLFIVAGYMGLVGIVESVFSYSPYAGLDVFRKWAWVKPYTPEWRLGLLRARTTTSVHIYFGMAMMLIAALSWASRSNPSIKTISTYTTFFAALGVFSSMSTGPWLAFLIMMGCNCYIFKPALIKPTIILLIGAAVFLELASNRHFYNLIDYIALNSGTAWYRTKLLEVAVGQWHEYWLFGTGGKSIHHWGALIDGRRIVDLVNNFLLQAVQGGVLSLFFYIAIHVGAIRYGVRARKKSKDPVQRGIIFTLISAIIALDAASMSVSLLGPPVIMANIVIGVLVSVSISWRSSESR